MTTALTSSGHKRLASSTGEISDEIPLQGDTPDTKPLPSALDARELPFWRGDLTAASVSKASGSSCSLSDFLHFDGSIAKVFEKLETVNKADVAARVNGFNIKNESRLVKIIEDLRSNAGLLGHSPSIAETYNWILHLEATQVNHLSLNRYLNILPYDGNVYAPRKDKMAPYFLNASEVKACGQSYIAAQGPMASTIGDFWKGIILGGSNKIICLAMEEERKKPKCFNYWSGAPLWIYDGANPLGQIVLVREELLGDAVEGEGTIKRTFRWTAVDKEETRLIEQYHYQNWPDFGVPNIDQFNDFQDHIRRTPTVGPLFTHCSAGVGRTGTFIAADGLRHHVETSLRKGAKAEEIPIDIFDIVVDMRRQRWGLIQTVDQLDCVYKSFQKRFERLIKAS